MTVGLRTRSSRNTGCNTGTLPNLMLAPGPHEAGTSATDFCARVDDRVRPGALLLRAGDSKPGVLDEAAAPLPTGSGKAAALPAVKRRAFVEPATLGWFAVAPVTAAVEPSLLPEQLCSEPRAGASPFAAAPAAVAAAACSSGPAPLCLWLACFLTFGPVPLPLWALLASLLSALAAADPARQAAAAGGVANSRRGPNECALSTTCSGLTRLPSVRTCSGSWMCPRRLVRSVTCTDTCPLGGTLPEAGSVSNAATHWLARS
jgi:hypothetical protein